MKVHGWVEEKDTPILELDGLEEADYRSGSHEVQIPQHWIFCEDL